MVKKKKPVSVKKKEFSSNPFNELKGLPGFAAEEKPHKEAMPPKKETSAEPECFVDEMELLGVKPINSASDEADAELLESSPPVVEHPTPAKSRTEDELFLEAMCELSVSFSDNLPEKDAPQTASARRMKQLKQGKLIPEASLDLHGLQRTEVADKLQFFLQDALYQGWRTVLVITGKGLHSEDGEPVLRSEAERFLNNAGRKWVAEWARAPQQYGGAGALVLFLRKNS